MKLKDLLAITPDKLKKMSKKKIIKIFFKAKKEMQLEIDLKNKEIESLQKMKEELQQEGKKDKEKKVNEETNKPSSKKPEWDKDGNPVNKKKSGKKSRKKKKGCGNQRKKNLIPEKTNNNPLEECPHCGTDLNQQEVLETNSRIVEDIPAPAEETTITEEVQERKWCPNCKKIVSSKTEKALPGSDIGINALILSIYFWVVTAVSLPNIKCFLKCFMSLKISTAGISKLLIRVSNILQPVYDEILENVKNDNAIWADETGWRIKGKLWWLWIFANKRSAYYYPDKSRGSPVVEKIIGKFFLGVLITDAWNAYKRIFCFKQTCMSHIFRKIRKFIETFPKYKSVMTFYLKLKHIIKDGKKLQEKRKNISEKIFQQKLKQLKKRLELLLKWKNPNSILKEIIKKVKRQESKILTFVEHEGIPSHNNYGEYIIRKGVLKRKVSGGSMSVAGAKAYACLQSIAQTCHLRDISFIEFLKETLICYIRTSRPLLLADYEQMLDEKNKIAA